MLATSTLETVLPPASPTVEPVVQVFGPKLAPPWIITPPYWTLAILRLVMVALFVPRRQNALSSVEPPSMIAAFHACPEAPAIRTPLSAEVSWTTEDRLYVPGRR